MKKKTVWDLNRPSLETYRLGPKTPVAVVLDNVRSLNNIGSIFRTCDAFAVSQIVLCGISATPPSPEIHKTALGAEDSVDWRYFPTTAEAVDTLRREGYTLLALEQAAGSIPLQDFRPTADGAPYAIIAGNEIDGVAQHIVDACHHTLEIPQHGTKHSLNVAVSTALCIWHLYLALHPRP